ncbi:MAG: ABC transporter substrate-binding protein [Candidatus Thorarchaeota archaeon]|nr:ABC transporter substrate-binding protein [Candidatus Thorarchaeota archaeon]
MKKKHLTCLFLAVFLVLPYAAVPAVATLDVTPELSYECWVLSWDDISVDTGTGLRTLLDDIGINFDVVIKDDDPMYEGLYQEPRTFAVYEMSHGYGSVPDHIWWRCHSENIIDWGDNCYGLDNATVDAALDAFLAATPATMATAAATAQRVIRENIPYIPLFLSDDTHAIRAEWTNYTLKPGGVFTSHNPQTMIFMYDTTYTSGDYTFVMAYPSDIGELNPMFYRSERSHWYDMLVYDTLISYDNNLDPIPWLAESFSAASNGLQLNFTIRSGVQWHDGNPLTVNDVNFTMHYYKNAPEDALGWALMQHMTDTEIDGNTLVMNFDQPFAFALQTVGELYILPEHTHDGVAADDERWNDPSDPDYHIGSGPYVFSDRVATEYTTVVRNDDWWGPDNPYVGQLPNIETVRIDVVRGQDARILAMRQGTADTERYEVFGPYVSTVLNAPELDLVTGVTSQWDYVVGFNMTVPGLDDVNVRRAIAYAINRQTLINIGRLGFGTATNSSIPAEYFPSFYSPEGVFYEYDVDTANDILDAAGYVDVDNDGIREFPGAAPPGAAPDLILIAAIGAGALVIGIVITYFVMKKK